MKGYALFAVPAVVIFTWRNRGVRPALIVGTLCVAPLAVANLSVAALVGVDAMLSPYRFHAFRLSDGESSYDALYYLTAFLFEQQPRLGGPFAACLQLSCALLAAAMRPRSFDDLLNALLVALLGFMSFSLFYSPQFILWVLPIVCLTRDRLLYRLAAVFGWVSYFHFPAFHVRARSP